MLKPLEDRILLKVDKKEEEVSSSGLILTSSKEVENTATVVSVGPGRILPNGVQLEPDVKVGDKVAFNLMATMQLEFEGQEYLSIFSRDILAIIEGE